MHVLDESHILLFLLQLLVLLGAARTLGALCEEVRIPAIAGEIVAGVLLGPTLFGRIAPQAQEWLFPHDPVQATMLETVSWLGVFFLLLASGFHVDVQKATRQGKAAVSIGVVGVIVPLAVGVPVFLLFDEALWGPAANRWGFALFLAVAGSITAISVVARAIGDLGMSSTEDGTLALSACTVNDLFGWLLFTVVLSFATAAQFDTMQMVGTFVGVALFVAACVLIGSQVMGIAVGWVQRTSLSQPAGVMTLVVTAGLLCGVITQWLGIHAILGFFLAGTMAGTAKGVSDELRSSLSETLHAVFVPVFFATLGLQIDFLDGINVFVTVVFTIVAMGGKFVGAWIGARLARVEPRRAVLMGIIFVPGGAMEIVVATLARELELIGDQVFVAIVFAALLSSVVVGPLIAARMGVGAEAAEQDDEATAR